jgi:hypothetical protein
MLGTIFISALVIALFIFIVIMFWMGARNEPESIVYVDNLIREKICDIFVEICRIL